MHKHPVSCRFITSSKSCSLSGLSKNVGLCLKTLLKSAKHYSAYDSKYSRHAKNYFIIDNNTDVIKFLKQSNKLKSKHKSIATYDFKTLYTSIPHDLLQDNIKIFMENTYQVSQKHWHSLAIPLPKRNQSMHFQLLK